MSSGAPGAPGATASVPPAERVHALDILRGLALCAMILVHFHQKMGRPAEGVEDLIGWGVYVLVEQKSWGTFAFLFGVGFAVLLHRLEARGAPVAVTYARRLAALAAFGVVAEVGFGFQILTDYAFWGVALLLVRGWSTRALLAAAVVTAVIGPVIFEARALHAWLTDAAATPSAAASLRRAAALAAEQGDYGALLSARWALFAGTLPVTWRAYVPDTNLPLFLVGMLAVRRGIFDDPIRHRRVILGWMTYGLVAWGLSWTVLRNLPAMPTPAMRWPLQTGFGLLQDQWLCLTYVGGVVLLLAYRRRWVARLRFFGDAGRLALTNYMLQVVVLDLLASGYGLGLKVRPYLYLPATALLFGAEALFSRAWLARYRFGPLEWLWRCVTYWRWQPMSRVASGADGSLSDSERSAPVERSSTTDLSRAGSAQ